VSTTAEHLYELLPAIYRIRDAEQGYPLRELIAVIAGQVGAMEENLEQLYDDQFIETCAPWAAPYIGDLIGYHSLHGVVPSVASPRADVANTIRYRRRKGTASMLEQVARDVTGWPARAVEFFELLGWTQHMNHLRADAHYAPDLRKLEKLHWRDSAFDTIAHTADMRQINNGAARHNIPNIGLYLWRVRAFSLTRSQAVLEADVGAGVCFRFNPLGSDIMLFNQVVTEENISHLAEPVNVPVPLTRRWTGDHLDDYYGPGKSLSLELSGVTPTDSPQLIPRSQIHICNLSDIDDGSGNITWAHLPAAGSGEVAVDPVLGRIAFADAPARPLLVSFHYGFTIAIGGGEYERGTDVDPADQSVQGGDGSALQDAFDGVQSGGVVEVADSYRYQGLFSMSVDAGATVTLRAANGARPMLVAGGDIALNMGLESTLILDGWVITGGVLTLAGNTSCKLILRDCTLVPNQAGPALSVANAFARVDLDRCITGSLHIAEDAEVALNECIIDATDAELVAFRSPDDLLLAGGAMKLVSCTVIGKVHTRELTLASDCLFVAAPASGGDSWKAPLWVDRRQKGCVRFSYVPHGSRTPRRYRCQPETDDVQTRPQFTSLRYGDPGYCQLRQVTPSSIRRGAHDESEMGVLHGLYQPQRETNLEIRLEEYLRFGLRAGLIYAS